MRHWLRSGFVATALVAGSIGVLPTQQADAASGFSFTRLQGANRFGTAADIAVKTFGTAPTVLLARADLFPDALAGGYLAGSTGSGAPILLTRTDSLPQETSDALTTLGATKAILLGGPAAINPSVEAALRTRNNGSFTTERVGGADRFETARLVAEKPGAPNVGATDSLKTAIVASGRNFPDALAGSPSSYAGKLPSLLTEPGSLPQHTRTALTNLAIKRVYLLGGTAAVSDAVQSAITAMGIEVIRLSGADRQATAVAIADSLAVAKLGFNNTHVNLARGDDFADALTFGPHAGKEKAVLVLSGNPTTLTPTTRAYLASKSPTLTDGHVAGGPAAVSDAVVTEATQAATGTANAVTVNVPNRNVAPGSNVSGTITGSGIESVRVSGCGINNAVVERTNQGAFSFAIPASATGSSCTLTFTSTLTGGGTETDTVDITLSSAAFTVAGPQAVQDVNTNRQCTASVPAGQVVTIMLLPSGNITNGTLFKDSAGAANQADEDVTNAKITNVNGTAVNPAVQKVVSTTSDGSITFTINSATADDVTAVVFANPAGGNGILDLVAPTPANTNPKAPSEAFGVGCRTSFVPPEATTGASTPTVTSVNRDLDFFIGDNGSTYFYDSNDTFQFGGQPLTMAQFEGALSATDVLGPLSYATEPSGTSLFNIADDNLAAATNVVAVAGNFDSGAANNDVRVTFDLPAANGPTTTYTVRRGTVTGLGADAACGGGDDTTPLTFTEVGTAEITTNPTTGAPQGRFTDLNPGNGCFQYRIVATNSGTNQSESATSESVLVPGAADTGAPTITQVRAQDNNQAGRVDASDVHRFIFSEPMGAAVTSGNYQVTDADSTSNPNITCGSGGTTCSLNAAQVTIGGADFAAGRVLTVTVGTVTATGGDTSLSYPVTVAAVSAGFEDAAGNDLNLAGSPDKVIEVASFA